MFKNNNRELLVHNDHYALVRVAEYDRPDYVELQRQINGDNTLFLNPISKDMMWDSVLADESLYIIIDDSMQFCGSMELQGKSRTPEIGISILEKYRNRGIAQNAVQLLMTLTFNPENIDYYVLRIEEGNSHSRHVFEKMGAVFLGEDLSTAEKFKESLNKDDWAEKQVDEILSIYINREGDSKVVKYKINPELFEKAMDGIKG